MAGAEEVVAGIERRPGVVYSGLVLNAKGAERFAATELDSLHFNLAATESFGRENQNATPEEALAVLCGDRDGQAGQRLDQRRVRLPLRGRRRSGPGAGDRRPRRASWAPPRSSSRTRSASPCRAGEGARHRGRAPGPARRASTSTTRGTRVSPPPTRRWRPARPSSRPRSAGWAAARSRRAPPATSPPRTSSTSCTGRGWKRVSTSTRSSASPSGSSHILGRELPGQVYRAGAFAPVSG